MTAARIQVPESLDQGSGASLLEAVRQAPPDKGSTLLLDFTATRTVDSGGGAWLMRVADRARAAGADLRFEGQSGVVAEYLVLIRPALLSGRPPRPRRANILEGVGALVLAVWAEALDGLRLCTDAIYWTLLAPFEGRGFRWGLFTDEIHEMGVRAVRIVSLMNLLLGLTISMLSAAQLRQLGLDIYVADLVMIGFARELAVVMTAVVVAARTGAAISAELATMKVQEEIDALRGMGLNVTQFLVAPKLLALVVVMPILTGIGMIMGVGGGAIWGTVVLKFTWHQWMTETLNAADVGDIFQGLLKSFFFANMIVLVGCHNGLRVTGGSRGVGLMTTRAVVMIIFMLIVIDMAFAAIFYYVLD